MSGRGRRAGMDGVRLALYQGLFAACACAQSQPLRLEPIKASEHVYYFQGEAGMAS